MSTRAPKDMARVIATAMGNIERTNKRARVDMQPHAPSYWTASCAPSIDDAGDAAPAQKNILGNPETHELDLWSADGLLRSVLECNAVLAVRSAESRRYAPS